MDQQQVFARELIVRATRELMREYRDAHGVGFSLDFFKGRPACELDAYLNGEREYINAQLRERIPADIRKMAV